MNKLWGADDLEAAWIDLREANLRHRWLIGNAMCEPGGEVWTLRARERRGNRAWRRLESPRARVRAMASHLRELDLEKVGSGGRTRTYDQAVNSRPLYH